MINGTATTTTLTITTKGGSTSGFPFWVYIIWAAVGLLATITVIVIIYLCVHNSKKKAAKGNSVRSPSPHQDDVNLGQAPNPQGIIAHLHGIGGQTKNIFSTSFVENMRIPRAMEVKMAQTVSHMNSSFVSPVYNAPFPQMSAPTSPQVSQRNEQWLLSATEWEGSPSPKGERKAPSRHSSFRFQEMDERERAEWLNKEKMLVYELREKLRKQGKIDEEELSS